MTVRPANLGGILLASIWTLPVGAQEGQLPPEAHGILLEARMEVALPLPGEAVSVRTSFLLLPGPSSEEIPLSLLTPGHTTLGSVQAYLDGQALSISGVGEQLGRREGPGSAGGFDTGLPGNPGTRQGLLLERTREHYWEGSVVSGEGAFSPSDSVSLEIRFLVEDAWSDATTATLPIIVPRWAPNPPTPRTFVAEVAAPDRYVITGSFPTSVLNRPRAGSASPYRIGLQGVPAMLVLRTKPGSGTFWTLERGLDLVVVLILIGMGLAGVRYLRRREA